MKGNDGGGWSSDGVVLWLGRRQNRDAIEWWGKWPRLRWSFDSSGEWESDGPERVSCFGGVDSMLRFRLVRGGNEMNHPQKKKRRQRARLGSMGRKRDTVRWCGDVSRRRGGAGEGKGRRQHQLG
jgi:hypothetical protein